MITQNMFVCFFLFCFVLRYMNILSGCMPHLSEAMDSRMKGSLEMTFICKGPWCNATKITILMLNNWKERIT